MLLSLKSPKTKLEDLSRVEDSADQKVLALVETEVDLEAGVALTIEDSRDLEITQEVDSLANLRSTIKDNKLIPL